MYVSEIRVKNFKTFDDVYLDLNNFNVLIGACGSGKTNFFQVFVFSKYLALSNILWVKIY